MKCSIAHTVYWRKRKSNQPGQTAVIIPPPALLSVHPFVQDQSQETVKLHRQKRRKMLRGILDVTIRLADGRLYRTVGAHLKSRVSENAGAADSLRKQDAALLRLSPADSRGEEWTLYYKRGKEYCLYDQIFVNPVLRERMRGQGGIIDIPAAARASDHRAL